MNNNSCFSANYKIIIILNAKKLVKLSSNEQHMNYDDFFCNLEIASIIHLKELQLS